MKKIIATALFAALAMPLSYYGVGYIAASHNATACEDIAFREATIKRIRGIDMSRREFSVQRAQVTSTISPYQVEVTYSIPSDLHAVVFIKKFRITARGEIHPGELQEIYLM